MSETGVHRGAQSEGGPASERRAGRRRGDRIVGASRATQEVVEQALAAAGGDLPVRISGPAGAGKEHLARAVHAWSSRGSGPFVVVSCAGIADALLGREIFGCAAAVYPTLPEEHEGALSRASGGTLLIDDVDRLMVAQQEALAKAVADGRFQREGDATSIALRGRIIVTSSEPLARSPYGDLPHHGIELAPLADRPEDVLPLAAHFLKHYASEEGIEAIGFTADARNALVSEPWPGNVRELGERVRQAIRLAGNGAVSAEALLLSAEAEEIPSFKDAKRAFETRYVKGLLRRCGGNISRAARLAKKDRKDFYDVIRRTGVDPAEFR
jgi:two-component system response regulator GlrR